MDLINGGTVGRIDMIENLLWLIISKDVFLSFGLLILKDDVNDLLFF